MIIFIVLPHTASRSKMFKYGKAQGMNGTSFFLSRLKIIYDLYNRLLNSCLTHTHTPSVSSLKSDTGFYHGSVHGKCYANIQTGHCNEKFYILMILAMEHRVTDVTISLD